MTQERWEELMTGLGFGPNTDVYDALHAAYSEKHRHYHTAAHIDHCLGLLDEFRHEPPNPDEVELALWFHDPIYNPMSRENEARSANRAETFLIENDSKPEKIARVRKLIMATAHEAPVADRDAQYLVDIDLSILGAERDSYIEFEKNVRLEYGWLPGSIFRAGRRKILGSFLRRDKIYNVDAFADRYETQARINLASAIRSL